mmetsp:Transcript_24293/g.41484  ORF Transcript_24293/g.41484 Transcript_24293/m.41484 type:complete len:252 (-) Transcript_24293:107-862(-)
MTMTSCASAAASAAWGRASPSTWRSWTTPPSTAPSAAPWRATLTTGCRPPSCPACAGRTPSAASARRSRSTSTSDSPGRIRPAGAWRPDPPPAPDPPLGASSPCRVHPHPLRRVALREERTSRQKGVAGPRHGCARLHHSCIAGQRGLRRERAGLSLQMGGLGLANIGFARGFVPRVCGLLYAPRLCATYLRCVLIDSWLWVLARAALACAVVLRVSCVASETRGVGCLCTVACRRDRVLRNFHCDDPRVP